MEEAESRGSRTATYVRVGLVALVVLWILGPSALRSAIPIWLVFFVDVIRVCISRNDAKGFTTLF